MKACILTAPGPIESNPLQIVELPIPKPGKKEVLIRVHVCGVCRTDLHVTEGELPPRKKQIVLGHQVVGVVEACGSEVTRFKRGARVGIPWLHQTCGHCEYCRTGRENLCEKALFTGWTNNGGYAEYATAPDEFVYPLPEHLDDLHLAPLLCAGIIGFRTLRLSGIEPGGRLGIYGFGAAAHVAIQVARYWNIDVYAVTRNPRHQQLALDLGAKWVGNGQTAPPNKLDAALIFAPAGEVVIAALRSLKRGATVSIGGIHLSPIPTFSYNLLYPERVIRSVANNTRQDGEDFLRLAAEIPIRTEITPFSLAEANQALNTLKNNALRGAAVLQVSHSNIGPNPGA